MVLALRDEQLISDGGTRHTPGHFPPERMLHQIDNAKSRRLAGFHLATGGSTVTPPEGLMIWTISSQSGGGDSQPNHDNLRQLIAAFENWAVFRFEPPDATTRASSQVTATDLADIRDLLRKRQRDERLSRMSPERRTLYDDIMKLREEIGPVGIDVAQILREIREE